MLGLVIGDRAVPLAWTVEAGPANIGFAGQEAVLEQVRSWLPAGASVLLLADRFYLSTDLFAWLHHHGWQYRLRLRTCSRSSEQQRQECQVDELQAGIEPALAVFR